MRKLASSLSLLLTLVQFLPIVQGRKGYTKIKAFKDGNFIIGGLFPVHTDNCTKFNEKGLSWVSAMIYAISLVNKDPDFLPNVTLGYDIRDDCNELAHIMEATMDFAIGNISMVRDTAFAFRPISGPPITPNFEVYDDPKMPNAGGSCAYDKIEHTQTQIAAVIGSASSSMSMAAATVLGAMYIPQISYSSTSRMLSNKKRYRAFIRTIPSDVYQVKAMADLISHYNWSYVSAIASNNIYGKLGIEALKLEIKRRGMCIAVQDEFPVDTGTVEAMDNIIQRLIKVDKAKVIILFCSNHLAKQFIHRAEKADLIGRTWIASESWGDEAGILKFPDYMVEGSLGFVPNLGNMSGFQNYVFGATLEEASNVNPWFDILLQKNFGCTTAKHRIDTKLPSCYDIYGRTSNLSTIFAQQAQLLPLGKVPNVVDAVKTIAHALKKYLKDFPGAKKVDYPEFLEYVKSTTFVGSQGVIKFDENGDQLGGYRILNIQLVNGKLEHVVVGHWDDKLDVDKLMLNESKIVFMNGGGVPRSVCSDPCKPGSRRLMGSAVDPCCWECVPCEMNNVTSPNDITACRRCENGMMSNQDHTECIPKYIEYLRYNDTGAIVALVVSAFCIILTLFVLVVFIIYRESPIVRVSNRNLSYVLLIGLALCFSLPFLYIGEPTKEICWIQPTSFGVAFTLCVAVMLTKTRSLLLIFNAKLSDAIKLRGSKSRHERNHALFVILMVAIEIVIGVTVTCVKVPGLHMVDKFPDKALIGCDSNGTIIQMVSMLYVGILSIICLVLAFQARKLPENYNEARYLSFSMFMLCLVWVITLPPYVWSDPTTGKTLMICFAMIAATFFILGFMFFPKLYIIFLYPEKNTLGYLRAQAVGYGSKGTAMRSNVGQKEKVELKPEEVKSTRLKANYSASFYNRPQNRRLSIRRPAKNQNVSPTAQVIPTNCTENDGIRLHTRPGTIKQKNGQQKDKVVLCTKL